MHTCPPRDADLLLYFQPYYQYQLIIFGMVMMITVIYFPIGIGGYYDRFFITKKFIKNQKESIEKIRKLENENT